MNTTEGCSHSQGADNEGKLKESLEKIRQILIVLSGKGGVGKSAVALNLALGLATLGFRAGLLALGAFRSHRSG